MAWCHAGMMYNLSDEWPCLPYCIKAPSSSLCSITPIRDAEERRTPSPSTSKTPTVTSQKKVVFPFSTSLFTSSCIPSKFTTLQYEAHNHPCPCLNPLGRHRQSWGSWLCYAGVLTNKKGGLSCRRRLLEQRRSHGRERLRSWIRRQQRRQARSESRARVLWGVRRQARRRLL